MPRVLGWWTALLGKSLCRVPFLALTQVPFLAMYVSTNWPFLAHTLPPFLASNPVDLGPSWPTYIPQNPRIKLIDVALLGPYTN